MQRSRTGGFPSGPASLHGFKEQAAMDARKAENMASPVEATICLSSNLQETCRPPSSSKISIQTFPLAIT
jgi:hypothetical protein